MNKKVSIRLFPTLGCLIIFLAVSGNCFAIGFHVSGSAGLTSASRPLNGPAFRLALHDLGARAPHAEFIPVAPSTLGVALAAASDGDFAPRPRPAAEDGGICSLIASNISQAFDIGSVAALCRGAGSSHFAAAAGEKRLPVPSALILLLASLMAFIGAGLQRQRMKCGSLPLYSEVPKALNFTPGHDVLSRTFCSAAALPAECRTQCFNYKKRGAFSAPPNEFACQWDDRQTGSGIAK